MPKFTVLSVYEEGGQIVSDHVEADNSVDAMVSVADERPEASLVAALPGHLKEGVDIEFAGEGLVEGSQYLANHSSPSI